MCSKQWSINYDPQKTLIDKKTLPKELFYVDLVLKFHSRTATERFSTA